MKTKFAPSNLKLDDFDELDDVLEPSSDIVPPSERAPSPAVRHDAMIVAWGEWRSQVRIGLRCGHCNGQGEFRKSAAQPQPCQACRGFGWYGIDPGQPAIATAGSSERIVVLAVRFAAGVPLSNEQDDVSLQANERLIDLLSFDSVRPKAGPVPANR